MIEKCQQRSELTTPSHLEEISPSYCEMEIADRKILDDTPQHESHSSPWTFAGSLPDLVHVHRAWKEYLLGGNIATRKSFTGYHTVSTAPEIW